MLPAYVYARFSSAAQQHGSSLSRQLDDGRAFAERMGWEWDSARQLTDEGMSAYHGANRGIRGALHAFEQRAAAGDFRSGAVLCVENADRLTRRGGLDAIDIIRALTMAGVTVATWHDNQVYEADKRFDLGKLMALIIKAELAHEESDKKSKRLKASWQKKIDKAAGGDRKAMTRVVPGWLRVDEQGVVQLHPHRAAVLNEVFDLYLEGRGLPHIVALLNERREPTWGLGRHGGKGWNVSTLHKYLTSRTVLGEYAPKVRGDDGSIKLDRGLVVADYYPKAVSAQKFDRVQVIRKQRAGWGGKNQGETPNLFSGIATCVHCGGPAHLTGQTKAGVTRINKHRDGSPRPYTEVRNRSYLRCKNAARSYGCENKRGVRYETLEKGVVDTLFALAARGQSFAPDSRAALLSASIAEQNRMIDHKRAKLNSLADNLTTMVSSTVMQMIVALEAEVDADKEALRHTERDLQQELGTAKPAEDMADLLALREAFRSDDEEQRNAARAKVHVRLRSLITRMELDEEGEAHVVIGRNAFYLHFNRDGENTGGEAGAGATFEGPDGQPDWHPDFP